MANLWLRLWHDMPTDPKWRTISKASGQRIGDVIAVYVHLMVCASANATERGRTQSFNSEDVANALDMETEQVASIVEAMQGRVMDGDWLKGWEARQVAREDGSAERAKAWREAKKASEKGEANAGERNRTQESKAERGRTPDKDKDTDKKKEKEAPAALTLDDLFNEGVSREAASAWIAVRKRKRAGAVTEVAWAGFKSQVLKAGWSLDAAVRKCVERNWVSFEADWVQSNTGETLREKRARERQEEMTGGLASAKPPGQPKLPGVFDVLALGMD